MALPRRIVRLAKRASKAPNLYELHWRLIAFEDALIERYNEEADTENTLRALGVDICELPTFGGPEPKSTVEIWSWDEDSVLCGIGPFKEWEIRERT